MRVIACSTCYVVIEMLHLFRFYKIHLLNVLMPRYYEEEKDSNVWKPACSGLREDLKECLAGSDCVTKDGHTMKECLKLGNHPSIPNECNSLRNAFFECKRSLLDMRTRFRGRKGY